MKVYIKPNVRIYPVEDTVMAAQSPSTSINDTPVKPTQAESKQSFWVDLTGKE